MAALEQERIIKATKSARSCQLFRWWLAMEKRLLVDDAKIDGMILSYNN
jgi:hypothetical protein